MFGARCDRATQAGPRHGRGGYDHRGYVERYYLVAPQYDTYAYPYHRATGSSSRTGYAR